MKQQDTQNTSLDISRIIFYTLCIIIVIVLSFIIGLYSASTENILYRIFMTPNNIFAKSFKDVSKEYTTIAKIRPEHFLQPSRLRGEGVVVNDPAVAARGDLILLASFFDGGNELRLIRRDGRIVDRWPVKYSDFFGNSSLKDRPKTDWNVDIHGALALPDGSVVFNLEYNGTVKLDKCGKLVWKLDFNTHHSIERAEHGGFWVCGRRYHDEQGSNPFPPFRLPFDEDLILKLSDDGKIEKALSVPGLFYRNGLEALLTSTGYLFNGKEEWDKEIAHLNKIEELSAQLAGKFPMFQEGDLILSLYDYNMLLVVDPLTEKIKWWKIGPWVRQHDPQFTRSGTILLFNNNAYHKELDADDHTPLDYPSRSNIMEFDPATGECKIVYGAGESQKMLSVIRGKVEPSENGYLITEFEAGRAFEVDKDGKIVWEYINRYDDDNVVEITQARLYPEGYFKVADWAGCNKGD
ncbi:MAG: arylsulfotransferase family protein [Thermodesulfobacteriota bacterium]